MGPLKKKYQVINQGFTRQTLSNSLAITLLVIVAGSLFLYLHATNSKTSSNVVHQSTPTVLSSFAHGADCYTQGLFFLNNTHLFESCGLYGESYVRVLELSTLKGALTVQETYRSAKPIQKNLFLQGATQLGDKIYVLTWQQYKVLELDAYTFELLGYRKWEHEGWGLTQNGTHMFASDGSAKIYIIDKDWLVVGELEVTEDIEAARMAESKTRDPKYQNRKTMFDQDSANKQSKEQGKQAVQLLNELEYADGFIFANVYMSTRIVKFDIKDGTVVASYNCQNIVRKQTNRQRDVLNGIAFNAKFSRWLLTGKLWNSFSQVQF